jgi:small subunit ribosomal protein S17
MTNVTATPQRGRRKTREGVIISNKMNKTVVVAVERRIPHRLYKKYHRQTSTFMAHDPENACQIGDRVRIMETRPLSRHKRWRLIEILERKK